MSHVGKHKQGRVLSFQENGAFRRNLYSSNGSCLSTLNVTLACRTHVVLLVKNCAQAKGEVDLRDCAPCHRTIAWTTGGRLSRPPT